MTKYALVGDVGGTNARLALCDIASGEISQAKTYSGLDYPSLEAVVRVISMSIASAWKMVVSP